MRQRWRQGPERAPCPRGRRRCGRRRHAGHDGRGRAAQQAAAPATVAVVDNRYEPADVAINTGETVTWNYNAGAVHNVAAARPGPPRTRRGRRTTRRSRTRAPTSDTFTQPGTYTYFCVAHPDVMKGTVEVTGAPVTPTPTPTTTATPTPTATASPTVSPTTTPGPSGNHAAAARRRRPHDAGAGRDRARRHARAPPLEPRPQAAAARRAGQLPPVRAGDGHAAVREAQRRSKLVRTFASPRAPGKRTVTVRGKRLRRGRYTVELQARDATGNASAMRSSTLRIGRR